MQPAFILDFWFRELEPRHWFLGSTTLDNKIRRRFTGWVDAALSGSLDSWAESPRGRLALILLLDQFTRNIHRGTPGAFAGDARAQALTVEGLTSGVDRRLNLAERHFFYMPLMHAENPKLQALSVEKFADIRREAESLMAYALDHAATIERFGRFPRRNAALRRISTLEEQAFLARPLRKAASGETTPSGQTARATSASHQSRPRPRRPRRSPANA